MEGGGGQKVKGGKVRGNGILEVGDGKRGRGGEVSEEAGSRGG